MDNKIIEEIRELQGKIAGANAELAYLKTFSRFPRPFNKKFLYFAQCGDAVKIGASNDPEDRIKFFETGSPSQLKLIAVIPKKGDRESYCHKKLEHLKIHGEWFRYTEEVDKIIKELQND